MELVLDIGELERIERAAITTLTPLLSADVTRMIAALKPRDDDYARIFIGASAEQARRGYRELWDAPPQQLGSPTQTEVLATAATAALLRTENPRSAQFPGGYRTIADQLQPERIWVRFELVEPGTTAGMSYDGLVWLEDRWAWFPKPWRYLTGTELSQEN
ncbi:hypothetical protein BH11MYX3_BH11MYX3_08250 [soil metagenome]